MLTGGYTPAITALMPDKRKKGKKQVAVWLTPEEKAILVELSRITGKTMSDILKERINEQNKKNQ